VSTRTTNRLNQQTELDIVKFAGAMAARLTEKQERYGTARAGSALSREQITERLHRSISDEGPIDPVNVANFAMMLWVWSREHT